MVILRTGKNRNKNIKTDNQGSKKKTIKKIKEEIHIIGYIKSANRNGHQVYCFDSDKVGMVYISANKELYSLGFYNFEYKKKDLKVLGTVNKNHTLKIKKIME